jgi:hypothetical protein
LSVNSVPESADLFISVHYGLGSITRAERPSSRQPNPTS